MSTDGQHDADACADQEQPGEETRRRWSFNLHQQHDDADENHHETRQDERRLLEP